MTIYDIAKEAEVSASTVSRVINKKSGIRQATRDKVEALLKKYDFTPDAAARGLVTQSSGIIGVLVQDIRVEHHVHCTFTLQEEMTKLGYACITMSTGRKDADKDSAIRILGERRVQGVVLIGSQFVSDGVRESLNRYLPDIPVVMVNGYLDLPNVSGVVVDEEKGVEDCVDFLVKKGRKHIAFINEAATVSNIGKKDGFFSGLGKNGPDGPASDYYQAETPTLEASYRMTEHVLKAHPDIDAVLYADDLMAAGGIRCALDLGYRIPEQLAVVGINNDAYSDICIPRITTLDNKVTEATAAAARILAEGLAGKPQHEKITLFAEIIEKETT